MGKFLLYIKSAPSSSTIEVTLTLHHFLISQITIDPFAKFHRQHRETCQRHVVLLTLRITKCLYSNKILLKFICYQKATKFFRNPKYSTIHSPHLSKLAIYHMPPNHQMPFFFKGNFVKFQI